MEKGWKGLKMAGHLMVATIGSPGTVSNGPTSFWAEPELDSFFFGSKGECFEQQHYIVYGIFCVYLNGFGKICDKQLFFTSTDLIIGIRIK